MPLNHVITSHRQLQTRFNWIKLHILCEAIWRESRASQLIWICRLRSLSASQEARTQKKIPPLLLRALTQCHFHIFPPFVWSNAEENRIECFASCLVSKAYDNLLRDLFATCGLCKAFMLSDASRDFLTQPENPAFPKVGWRRGAILAPNTIYSSHISWV